MRLKKVLCIILSVICAFIVIFSAVFCPRLIDRNKLSEKAEYKGVLSVWQIDSFAGGVGSRRKFLLKASRKFEKENTGVYFMVTNQTITSAKENIKNGIYPDVISYSYGLDLTGIVPLCDIKSVNLTMCKLNGKVYAYPWCYGGYYLIIKDGEKNDLPTHIDKLIVSQAEYHLPLLALLSSGVTVDSTLTLPQDKAYIEFAYNGGKYLLGTQRDVIRLENNDTAFSCVYLSEYNDLIQFVSVFDLGKERLFYSQKFCEFLLSESVQSEVNSLGMSAVTESLNTDYERLNATLLTDKTLIPNVFLSSDKIKEIQSGLKDKNNQNKEYYINLKNIIN